jgi:hypothetical protein
MARRDKRTLAAVGFVIVALLTSVGVWSATHPGSYGSSHAGCVTVSFPSSTGGALVHDCGAKARALCRQAFRHDDRLALLTRPQCHLAGLTH